MKVSVCSAALNLLRMPIRALCAVLLAAIPGSSFLQNPPPQSAQDLRRIEMRVHQAVNHERQAARIPQLVWNERLAAEAGRHAANMARKSFFAHEDPSRGDLAGRLDASHIAWTHCAENLYEINGPGDPVKRAVAAWLRSPSHRKNMLDAGLREAGTGVALRRDGTLVIVQELMSYP